MDAGRKRKLGFAEGEFSYSTSITPRKPIITFCSDDPLGNLQEEQEEQEDKCVDKSASLYGSDCRGDRGETTESSLVEVESFNQVSAEKPMYKKSTTRHRRSVEVKMPPMDEIEEFFSAAETNNLKTSGEKYNFDFEKEEPLEGRYEWVRLGNYNIEGFVAPINELVQSMAAGGLETTAMTGGSTS